MINPEFAPKEWRVENPASLIGSGARVCMLEDPWFMMGLSIPTYKMLLEAFLEFSWCIGKYVVYR